MKKLIRSFIFISVFLLQGCDVMTYNTFTSYVTAYYDYDDIALSLTDNGNIRISYDTVSSHKEYSWNSSGQNKVVYDSLCKVHNDLGYDKKRGYIAMPDWGSCSTFDIAHIDVVSNANFDAQHPSGTSLNDLVYFISVSPKKYIDSGYNYSYDWANKTPEIFDKEQEMYNFRNSSESSNYNPINKKLSETAIDEMVLLPAYYFGYLVFDSSPTTIKKHTLTVTFSLCNGKVISKTIEKTFN